MGVRQWTRRIVLFAVCGVSAISILFADTNVARMTGKPSFSEGKALGYFVGKDGNTRENVEPNAHPLIVRLR